MTSARITLKVQGLDCPVEAAALRKALEGKPGIVGDLGFDLPAGTMTVAHDPTTLNGDGLVAMIAINSGMKAELIVDEITAPGPDSWWARNGRWFTTMGSGLMLLSGVLLDLGHSTNLSIPCYAMAVLIGGIDLLPRSFRSLMSARLDIHVLMGLAMVGACVLGQWDEAATLAFLFGLSEWLEALSLARAQNAVRTLLEIAPETAERINKDGSTELIPAGDLLPGHQVRVRPGERVPVDGVVVSGRSTLDQKAITGESTPVLREPGDLVYAGTVNGEGAIDVRASVAARDTVASRIARDVRLAQASRAPVERSIERFAAWYTPGVLIVAVAMMLIPVLMDAWLGRPLAWQGPFRNGLVALVIACPCALVIATPVAVVSAMTSAARRGILIKGGQYLEAFGRLKVLAFDKTGTLTKGEPDVVEVVAMDGQGEDMLKIAAAMGDRGGHVVGRAIARHARRLQLDVPAAESYAAVPGLGASAMVESVQYHLGNHRYIDESHQCRPDFHGTFADAETKVGTAVALTSPSGPLGYIRLADRPRSEAAEVLLELRELGIETAMLTGDNSATASAIASQLGIHTPLSGLLPGDKADAVRRLQSTRGLTGMVGDGLNDAPALAAAGVSVAMGGIGSAAALEVADIVLMRDDLTSLPWLVRHARLTLYRIKQNIVLALITKVIVLILAMFGMANLWLAIAADVGTSLVVTANALRLLHPAPAR